MHLVRAKEGFAEGLCGLEEISCLRIIAPIVFLAAQRYATDLYPFLIFCLVVFLGSGGTALLRSRHLLTGLVALSVVINSLATVSWLINADQNVPAETKAAWENFLGRHSYEKWR